MDHSDSDDDRSGRVVTAVCHNQAKICDFRCWVVDLGHGEDSINVMVAIPDSNQETQVSFMLRDVCKVVFATSVTRALLKKWRDRDADIKAGMNACWNSVIT